MPFAESHASDSDNDSENDSENEDDNRPAVLDGRALRSATSLKHKRKDNACKSIGENFLRFLKITQVTCFIFSEFKN